MYIHLSKSIYINKIIKDIEKIKTSVDEDLYRLRNMKS